MTLGAEYFGAEPFGFIEGAGSPNPVVQAWEAETGRVFLYELTAYQRGGAGMWTNTFGTVPFGALPDSALITGETTFRFSDVGYISKPTDMLANTGFDPSVNEGLRLTRTAPATPEAGRRVTQDLGGFSLINTDGELDSAVRAYSVDGRRVRVLLGMEEFGYADFTPIFTGRIESWANNLSLVRVPVRDESYRLDQILQADLYGGTGGYDGGADVAGKPRPLCFGQVLNIAPPLIDAANLVYQFHSRAAQAVDAVYDRAAGLTATSDYASYALLIAASLSTGQYATCLAKGLIRLGSKPSGLVTADVKGDATGGYVDTTGLIAARIIKDFGLIADTERDLALWDAFTTGLPGAIGIWWGTDSRNVSDALDEVFAHCAGWWGADPTGLFQVGRLALPSSDSYTLDIDEDDCISFEFLEPLQGTFPPRFRQRVGYQRLFTLQGDQDIASSVTAARRQFLAQEQRIVSATDTAVQGDYLLATDPSPLGSLFANASDAQSLADGLLALYKAQRQTARVVLPLMGLGARLNATVMVTHSRLNGGSPTPMRAMDITIVADKRQVELVLWG